MPVLPRSGSSNQQSRRTFLHTLAGGSLGCGALALSTTLAEPKHELSKFDTEAVERQLAKRLGLISIKHPQLHFDKPAAASFLGELSGKRLAYAKQLFGWVDRNRKWSPTANIRDKKFSNTVLEEEGAFVTNVALAYVLSGRPDHLKLVRSRTLALCQSPPDRMNLYSLGMYVASLARVYDWLHAEFTSAERKQIREHIAHIVQAMYAGSLWGVPGAHWWSRYPLHHDYWIPVGGFGEAALALLGEVPEAANWAARAKRLMDVSWSWVGDDGAWHEGVGDWCYAVAPMLMFYAAWKNVIGENLHDRPWIRNTSRYRLYHWLPDGRYAGLNDSFTDGRYGPTGAASCHLLRRMASLYRDGYAQWLAEQDEKYDTRPGGKGVQRAPHEKLSYREELRDDIHADAYCRAWNFLWYDDTVKPKPPTDLPKSHHFENAGVVVVRSDWKSPNTTVTTLSCGPLGGHRTARRVRSGEALVPGNVAHAHADYNSLTLYSNGEYFIVPPGYARRSSRFQNTVAVNGADFLTDAGRDVKILAFLRERDFTYVVGDATAAFPSSVKVASYRRHLWFHSGGRLLLFDELKLADANSRYWDNFQWTLHSDPRQHRVVAKGAQLEWQPLKKKTPKLRVHVLEPKDFAWEHAKLQSLDDVAMLEAHRLLRPEWYSDRMHVLAEFTTETETPPLTIVRHEKFIGVTPRIGRSGPAIAFATSPMTTAELRSLSHPDLKGSKLLLFGHDEKNPESFVSETIR